MIGNKTGSRGFSLFEMLIVVSIIGVIALAAVPIAEISFIRSLEAELEESLAEIRTAIAQYKSDCISFLGRKQCRMTTKNIPESELYPRELIHLVNPIEVAIHDRNGNIVKDKAGNDVLFKPQPYLSKIPSDPFIGSALWATHCASNGKIATYPDHTIASLPGTGTYDVSVATVTPPLRRGFIRSISGTDYRDW